MISKLFLTYKFCFAYLLNTKYHKGSRGIKYAIMISMAFFLVK